MVKKLLLLLLYFGVVPIGLSVLSFLIILALPIINIIVVSFVFLVLGGLIFGFIASEKLHQKDQLTGRIIPFFFPLIYTLILWGIFMFITGGVYEEAPWMYYAIAHIPWGLFYLFEMFYFEGGGGFLWTPLAYELSFLLGVLVFMLKKRTFSHSNRNTWWSFKSKTSSQG